MDRILNNLAIAATKERNAWFRFLNEKKQPILVKGFLIIEKSMR
jgi:hypothetical protein